jgi:hypothetical protein
MKKDMSIQQDDRIFPSMHIIAGIIAPVLLHVRTLKIGWINKQQGNK